MKKWQFQIAFGVVVTIVACYTGHYGWAMLGTYVLGGGVTNIPKGGSDEAS